MIVINKVSDDISYTKDDTFRLMLTPEDEGFFEEGMQLRFVIAKTEESEYIIDKTININSDLYFDVTLTSNETSKLELADYIYKMILIKNNTVVTRKSGHFEVKWGA